MSINRSPEDGVLEINLRSFGLKTVFVLMTVVAVALALWAIKLRTPLRNATVSWANCYRKDWDALTASRPHTQQGEIAVYNFKFPDPQELFADFSVQPKLVTLHLPNATEQKSDFWSSGVWDERQSDRPVDGGDVPSFLVQPGTHKAYDFRFSGTLNRSTISTRKFIDCDVSFIITDSPGNIVCDNSKYHLQFHGSAQRGLVVFAIPQDDDLMRLVIVDLDGDPSASGAAGNQNQTGADEQ